MLFEEVDVCLIAIGSRNSKKLLGSYLALQLGMIKPMRCPQNEGPHTFNCLSLANTSLLNQPNESST